MAKRVSTAIKFSDAVLKCSIYLLIFLLPILYLPWVSGDFDFPKQALLVLLVSIALFFWLIKILVSKKISFAPSKVHFAVLFLILAFLLSNIFSIDRYGSFWGWPRVTSDSLISIICLAVAYFLISNNFSKKEIIKSIYVFLLSALIAQITGILEMLNLFVFPSGFLKIFDFNTIGSPLNIGFFSASLIPLLVILLIRSKGWGRVFFSLQLLTSATILLLANYYLIWWFVVFGSASVIALALAKWDFFDRRWLVLPMFFLMMSLAILTFNSYINWLPHKTSELSLSQKISFGITLNSLKKSPVFGSGPGTFAYDFSKYRTAEADNNFHGIAFNRAGSKFLTDLATAGILEMIAFLALLDLVIFSGIKFIFRKIARAGLPSKKGSALSDWFLVSGIFLYFLTQSAVIFLCGSILALNFIYFLTIAFLLALGIKKRKEYEFNSLFRKVVLAIIFLIVVVFSSGVLFLEGQRVAAEIYAKNLDFQSAANLNPSFDGYFRQLALINVSKLQEKLKEIQDPNSLNDQQKNDMQIIIQNSINSSKRATDLDANNGENWLVRGYVYQNLVGLIDSAPDWAITSYSKVLELDPQNTDIQKIIDKIKAQK